ncbi:glycosyltransferase family 1 protein [Bacillus sp. HMF5848]|uniref:glycosyltransferase family 4 protein n=1 Tax=Bacillus sp. HMF5848 TaxID=2495421 RepID=UPI000F79FA4C|nr:glycosyltransferase family 1 protein [Bacillus sp. HMF5848]RSK28250.1 glycosyltransferase family 1 protein [Bacillus sp. HMF5848]
MKIAIFTDTFSPDVNGVARTLKRFTDYLQSQNIEFRVFAPDSNSDRDIFSTHIRRFASLPFFLYPECRVALPNMLSIKTELQAFQPDIIHIATPFNIGLCGLHYAKKFNIPVVGSYHTDFDHYLEYYDLQFLSKLLWRYMHWFHEPLRKIFVPSIDTLEHLKRHGFTNLSVWSRGVDFTLFHPNYDKTIVREKFNISEKYILTYVGRLAPEKDVQLLPTLARSIPDYLRNEVHWLIVGDGPSKEEIMKDAPINMTFAGYQSGKGLAASYAASDLFVFPSTTETFGNVVLEALACGTPAICANAGGVKNIVQHGKTGMLCTPKDINDFQSAITHLLRENELRTKMGTAANAYARTQSWEKIFDQLLFEYEKAIDPSTAIQYA